jgi:hypothetical protein
MTAMSDPRGQAPHQDDEDLAARVPAWIDWAQAAQELGVTVAKVRTMIREHELAAAVPVPGQGQRIPADFLMDGLPVKGLPGRPIDALRENRGSEAKRRAQALGF